MVCTWMEIRRTLLRVNPTRACKRILLLSLECISDGYRHPIELEVEPVIVCGMSTICWMEVLNMLDFCITFPLPGRNPWLTRHNMRLMRLARYMTPIFTLAFGPLSDVQTKVLRNGSRSVQLDMIEMSISSLSCVYNTHITTRGRSSVLLLSSASVTFGSRATGPGQVVHVLRMPDG